MHKAIAFIGAGKMACALMGGLIKAGHPANMIWASCPTSAHLKEIQQRFNIHITEDNAAAASQADILVLAVKPHLILEILTQLTPVITKRKPLVISIAAGITIPSLHATLKNNAISIIRAMPNTPALVGRGMTVLYAPATISQTTKQQAEAIFKAVGAIAWIEDEEQMLAVTALSGSGPAYFFLLMEALEKAGVALGLSSDTVRQLVLQTALGSVYLAAEGETFAQLRQTVTSKGGGTERAIKVLESGQFERLLLEAVTAAKNRYQEMGA